MVVSILLYYTTQEDICQVIVTNNIEKQRDGKPFKGFSHSEWHLQIPERKLHVRSSVKASESSAWVISLVDSLILELLCSLDMGKVKVGFIG